MFRNFKNISSLASKYFIKIKYYPCIQYFLNKGMGIEY